jgi:hypothetical protein
MCEALGTGILRLDRRRRKLHGVIACGCGERAIPISEAANGRPTLGIDYEPLADRRPADLTESEEAEMWLFSSMVGLAS